MQRIAVARVLSIVGHPALLMPAAVAAAASGPGAPPQLLRVALGTALAVAVIVGLVSLWQVHSGRWAHVDASQRHERSQLNGLLVGLLCAAAALLWVLGQPPAVAAGPLLAALLVLLAQALRRWLKVSLHAAFALLAAALIWPQVPGSLAVAALAVGVAWSRLVLGRHTLPEVLTGLLLGAAFGAAVRMGLA